MKNISILLFTIVFFGLSSCKENNVTHEKVAFPKVSVKTVSIIQGDIENTISLNGRTVYLKKNALNSPIAGFIVKSNVKFGDIVKKNEVLFQIQTKENKALENTKTINDKSGIINVLASADGVISELNVNETGGYILEGTLLCSIVDNTDVLVEVNVPYEYNAHLKIGEKCKLSLADNTNFDGFIYQVLPVIDNTNQTQIMLIKPIAKIKGTQKLLPENLNLIVHLVTAKHVNSSLIPKEAVMTNETQNDFWVMKIVNDSLAVKIPIIKGIENDSIVEIQSPVFTGHDLIITNGAYALPDSTIVKIVK